jgi:hypothetical protein
MLIAPQLAVAQSRSVNLTSCVPDGFSMVEAWRKSAGQFNRTRLTQERQEEAQKIGQRQDVWRDHDRLYLGLDDDKVAILTDCPYAEGRMQLHFYQGFDEAGRFHITTWYDGDDSYYVFVSRREGVTMRARSLPLWSPDRKRFVYGACNLLAGDTRLNVVGTSGGELIPEAAIKLPCTTAPNCQFAWDNDSAISITCANLGVVSTRLRAVFRNGSWITAASP